MTIKCISCQADSKVKHDPNVGKSEKLSGFHPLMSVRNGIDIVWVCPSCVQTISGHVQAIQAMLPDQYKNYMDWSSLVRMKVPSDIAVMTKARLDMAPENGHDGYPRDNETFKKATSEALKANSPQAERADQFLKEMGKGLHHRRNVREEDRLTKDEWDALTDFLTNPPEVPETLKKEILEKETEGS